MSETTKVVIEHGWVWYEKRGDEWHLFTKNGGNNEVTSRVVTATRSHVPVYMLLDALAAARREVETVTRERDKARGDVNRWVQAAMAATMPDEFGLAFDPTNPEGWAMSRRAVFERVLNERDTSRAALEDVRRVDCLLVPDGARLCYNPKTCMIELWDDDTDDGASVLIASGATIIHVGRALAREETTHG